MASFQCGLSTLGPVTVIPLQGSRHRHSPRAFPSDFGRFGPGNAPNSSEVDGFFHGISRCFMMFHKPSRAYTTKHTRQTRQTYVTKNVKQARWIKMIKMLHPFQGSTSSKYTYSILLSQLAKCIKTVVNVTKYGQIFGQLVSNGCDCGSLSLDDLMGLHIIFSDVDTSTA